ncbi:MAG: 2-oxo acid dehydrogenase subunit E2 [Myxococcales bacterium]|nr:2-oxo acid dehydrogenase subunit E2 [Myxococcales bacterium]
MTDIAMPSLGADMDAGRLVEWRVKPGDTVHRGDVLALVETEKATMELESWHDGVVAALVIEPGTKVPVGTVILRLASGEGATPPPSSPPPPSPSASPPPPASPSPPASPAPLPGLAPRVLASPAARHHAHAHDLDLRRLTGSGRHGVILLRDVERARTAAAAPPPSSRPPTPAPAPAAAALAALAAAPAAPRPSRPEPPPVTPLRDAIAAAMTRSKREIPHYYLSRLVSMRRALDALARTNAALPVGERILPAALYLRAVARALWDVPELNGAWVDGFRPSEAVHLGFAVALRGGGVLAPAIHDADQKSVAELMADLRDLVRRARGGGLRTRELADPTITITSVGDRGADAVWGVINPPQVAIVGVGAIVERPWVEAGAVVVHPTVTLTLSADHRVSDGHRGGVFLAAVDHYLQEPELP